MHRLNKIGDAKHGRLVPEMTIIQDEPGNQHMVVISTQPWHLFVADVEQIMEPDGTAVYMMTPNATAFHNLFIVSPRDWRVLSVIDVKYKDGNGIVLQVAPPVMLWEAALLHGVTLGLQHMRELAEFLGIELSKPGEYKSTQEELIEALFEGSPEQQQKCHDMYSLREGAESVDEYSDLADVIDDVLSSENTNEQEVRDLKEMIKQRSAQTLLNLRTQLRNEKLKTRISRMAKKQKGRGKGSGKAGLATVPPAQQPPTTPGTVAAEPPPAAESAAREHSGRQRGPTVYRTPLELFNAIRPSNVRLILHTHGKAMVGKKDDSLGGGQFSVGFGPLSGRSRYEAITEALDRAWQVSGLPRPAHAVLPPEDSPDLPEQLKPQL